MASPMLAAPGLAMPAAIAHRSPGTGAVSAQHVPIKAVPNRSVLTGVLVSVHRRARRCRLVAPTARSDGDLWGQRGER
jgi:hypothetical protein